MVFMTKLMERYVHVANTNVDLPLVPLLDPANHTVQLLLMLSLMQADEMLLNHLSEKNHEWYTGLYTCSCSRNST